MKVKLLLIFTGIFSSFVVMADGYFYCKKSSVYIYLGDTLEKVNQLCDPPINKDIIAPRNEATQKRVDQWVYNFQPNSGFREDLGEASRVMFKKEALVVNFKGDIVSQIFVDGKTVNQTNFCRPDKPLYVGDTQQTVVQFCANPSAKRKAFEQDISYSKQQIIYTYRTNNFSPPTKLIFEDGKLMSIRTN